MPNDHDLAPLYAEPFIVLEGEAFLDYFDDGGTNMGIGIDVIGSSGQEGRIWTTISDSLDDETLDPELKLRQEDHPVHKLLGRRIRVTVELLGQ